MGDIVWRADGATVTVAPDRARVRQVRVDGHDAFWGDPAATTWNVGGDRLWLGPEWAWYWTDLGSYDVTTHRVQAAVDPGEWRADGTTASHEVTLTHLHGGGDVRARVSRSFRLLDPAPNGAAVAYAATARLDLLDPPDDAAVTLWSLVQVPPGGDAYVPRAGDPRDYFDPAPPGAWSRVDEGVRVHLGGDALFKLGFAPRAGVDRYAYVRRLADGRHLVVARYFRVEPGAAYSDVPLHDRESPGDAVEVFCDGGRLGGFSEVEHHSPAATAARPGVTDESVLTVSLVDDPDAWRAADRAREAPLG